MSAFCRFFNAASLPFHCTTTIRRSKNDASFFEKSYAGLPRLSPAGGPCRAAKSPRQAAPHVQEMPCHCSIFGQRCVHQTTGRRAPDEHLHLPGRAELPLCPEYLGGAAAPPYRRHEDFCPASPAGSSPILQRVFDCGGRTFAQEPPGLAHPDPVAFALEIGGVRVIGEGLAQTRQGQVPLVFGQI